MWYNDFDIILSSRTSSLASTITARSTRRSMIRADRRTCVRLCCVQIGAPGIFDVMKNDELARFIIAKLAAEEPLAAICTATDG